MLSIKKFVKENTFLCICTLGLAIVGYLGYHSVRWIINKCQRTQKVDVVAQQNLKPPIIFPPKSLINRVSHLEISPDKITKGQGEYIIFHQLPNGQKQQLSKETFEQVYKILNQHAPLTLIQSGSDNAAEECANRYELIKAKIKEIDSTLELVFIPRTLYELIFIEKCIREDLRDKKICPFLLPLLDAKFLEVTTKEYESYLNDKKTKQIEKKCWHLCHFMDAGDNEHLHVKNVAYRLNKAMIKAFNPTPEGFTHQELSTLAEKEIEFLKMHYKKCNEELERERKGEGVKSIANCNTPGPTTNFGFESYRGSIKPMGIRHEKDAQIIRNAIALECSQLAHHSLFLYRGGHFQKDSAYCLTDRNIPYSVSLGTSLFAGCVHDGGATAFHFMRDKEIYLKIFKQDKENEAYAIPIPFDQVKNSVFYIPPKNTVAQLFGDGEIFHARTKAWKDFDLKKLKGMNMGANGYKRDHLTSHLNQEEHISQFQYYKNQAVQLK